MLSLSFLKHDFMRNQFLFKSNATDLWTSKTCQHKNHKLAKTDFMIKVNRETLEGFSLIYNSFSFTNISHYKLEEFILPEKKKKLVPVIILLDG